MKTSMVSFVLLVLMLATVSSLTIKRFETTPKPPKTTTTTLPTTTVSSKVLASPKPTGPIVVLQHHGTLDGPSGRFRKTTFQNAPPVDLSVPPVFLPEFIPIFENTMELEMAASNENPRFPRTQFLAAPPVDLNRPIVLLPEATPITEDSHDVNPAKQALLFVRG